MSDEHGEESPEASNHELAEALSEPVYPASPLCVHILTCKGRLRAACLHPNIPRHISYANLSDIFHIQNDM